MIISKSRLKKIIKEELTRFINEQGEEGLSDKAAGAANVGKAIADKISAAVEGVNPLDPRFQDLGQAVVLFATARSIAIEKMVSKVSADLISALNDAPAVAGGGKDLKLVVVFTRSLEQKAKEPSSGTKKDPEAPAAAKPVAPAAAGQRSHADRLRAMIAKQKEKLKDPTKRAGGMKAELERSIKELEAKLAEAEAGANP